MRTTIRFLIALKLLDVLYRADCDYVPLRAVRRVYPEIKTNTLKSVAVKMENAGMLVTRKGPAGGYHQNRNLTLKEIYALFCEPNKAPLLALPEVTKAFTKIDMTMEKTIIKRNFRL